MESFVEFHFQIACKRPWWAYVFFRKGAVAMKSNKEQAVQQPEPFTPGLTKGMIRQHAYAMFRDKLPDNPLTLEDWVMAEKDLASTLDNENMPK